MSQQGIGKFPFALLLLASAAACSSEARTQVPAPVSAVQVAPVQVAPEPITLRSSDLLRRDLEGLASRHGLPPPIALMMTRSALGEYFLGILKKLSTLPKAQLTDQDYDDIGMLSEEFERSFRVMRGKMAVNVLNEL